MQETRNDDVLEIDLLELFGLLLHKLWLLILCMVLAGGIGFLISSFLLTPQYESTTGVYILSSSADSNTLSYSDTHHCIFARWLSCWCLSSYRGS